jgi:ABC-2 type transport system permease protein
MRVLCDSYLLFKRPFMQYLRNPMFVFINIATPLMYLVLFTPLLKKLSGPGFNPNDAVQIFLPGIIALFFAMTGLFSVYPTIFELKGGLIERFRVTPASRFALLIGPILMWNAWTLISYVIIVIVGMFYGFHVHILGLLIFAALLVMVLTIFAAWVTALAIQLKGDITSISGTVSGLNLPILLTAGVMLPLSLAPSWIRWIAHINPLYYVVEAGRDLAAGHITTYNVGLAFAVITPLTILVLLSATRVYQKAVA